MAPWSLKIVQLIIASQLFLLRSLSDVVDCYSEESTLSGSNNGDQARINNACSGPGYTLVSCGFRTDDESSWENQNGGFITGTDCIAQAGVNSPVYAIARCCDFRFYNVTCASNQSPDSNLGNDETTYQNCGHMSKYPDAVITGWYVMLPILCIVS